MARGPGALAFALGRAARRIVGSADPGGGRVVDGDWRVVPAPLRWIGIDPGAPGYRRGGTQHRRTLPPRGPALGRPGAGRRAAGDAGAARGHGVAEPGWIDARPGDTGRLAHARRRAPPDGAVLPWRAGPDPLRGALPGGAGRPEDRGSGGGADPGPVRRVPVQRSPGLAGDRRPDRPALRRIDAARRPRGQHGDLRGRFVRPAWLGGPGDRAAIGAATVHRDAVPWCSFSPAIRRRRARPPRLG